MTDAPEGVEELDISDVEPDPTALAYEGHRDNGDEST